MAPKRATFISYGTDDKCLETRRFIENAGIDLEVRDLLKKPFTEDEAFRLLGNWDLMVFLNPASEAFEKHGLDQKMPDRHEVARLIAADPTLLRRPIIKNSRLMTIGCDKRKIAEMLQISMNGKSGDDDNGGNGNQQPGQSRQSTAVQS